MILDHFLLLSDSDTVEGSTVVILDHFLLLSDPDSETVEGGTIVILDHFLLLSELDTVEENTCDSRSLPVTVRS